MVATVVERIASRKLVRSRSTRDVCARAASPRVVLSGIVAVSFALRALAGFVHVVPYYFADEYTYVALARGIARHGGLVVRGAHTSFPAMLEPLTTAPVWALADGETAMHLIQVLHALEMSLAAVPVYLIATRIGLSPRASLLSAGFTVISPGLFWSSFMLSDPLSYVLALAAVWAAVKALDEATARSQLLFLGLAGLAVLARTQFVVLGIAYVAAAVVTERGNVVGVLRRHRIVTAAGLLGAGAGAAMVAHGGLGPYRGWLHPAVDPSVFALSALLDLSVVALASGIVLVPGALLGLDLALSKPRSRSQLALAAFGLFTACALVALASFGAEVRVQERYLITLVPLVPIFFLYWTERDAPRAHTAAALGGVFAALALVLRLPSRAATHSASLWAFDWLSAHLHVAQVGYAVVATLGAASVLLARRGAEAARAALGLAAAAMIGLSFCAFAFDRANARGVRDHELPADRSWIDWAARGSAVLLQTAGAPRGPSLQQLFWNDRLNRVLSMQGADQLDSFEARSVEVDPAGRLLVGRELVRKDVLVPRRGAPVALAGATLVRRTLLFELWRPRGPARLAWVARGVAGDGRLLRRARITVWPPASRPRARSFRLVFELPASSERARSVSVRSGATIRHATVAAGTSMAVVVPVGPGRSVVTVDVSPGGIHLRPPTLIDGVVAGTSR